MEAAGYGADELAIITVGARIEWTLTCVHMTVSCLVLVLRAVHADEWELAAGHQRDAEAWASAAVGQYDPDRGPVGPPLPPVSTLETGA